jgi:hypothetical protein
MTLPASTITGILYVLTVPHLTCGRISYNEDENNPSSEGGELAERIEGKLSTGRAITGNRRLDGERDAPWAVYDNAASASFALGTCGSLGLSVRNLPSAFFASTLLLFAYCAIP